MNWAFVIWENVDMLRKYLLNWWFSFEWSLKTWPKNEYRMRMEAGAHANPCK